MKTVLYLTILVGIFPACSSLQDQRSRTPSSVSMKQQSCSQAISVFTTKSQKIYSLKELSLKEINLTTVKSDVNFRELASVNGNEEIQEKTFYILALIKKQYPDESTDQIISRYSKMLKECS